MKKEFYTYHQAILYQHRMEAKGMKCQIYEAYNQAEQRTIYSVIIEKIVIGKGAQ